MKCEMFLEDEHYPIIALWWHEHKFPATPAFLLPKTGLVMLGKDDQPLCVGFLYSTDGGFAAMDHIVSDPSSDKEERSLALDTLILNLFEIAKMNGARMVSAASNHPALVERYEKLGFKRYDEGVTHLGKEI